MGALVLHWRHQIAYLFVDDVAVLAELDLLIPYTTAYSVGASLAPGWSQQTLFGLGTQLYVPAAVNFVSFFGVGLPAGAVLAFQAGMSARGLWLGLVIAMGLIVVGQYTFIATAVDWAEAARVARRKALKKPAEDSTSGIEAGGQGLAAADSAKEQQDVPEATGSVEAASRG